MVISYAITTHNESEEINELLGILVHHIQEEDERIGDRDGEEEIRCSTIRN